MPDQDFYRDDAMALVREEIDETRRLAKGWEETERVFLEECKALEARQRFVREIGAAIENLSKADTCESWRKKFVELHATCQVARETILIPPEMWPLFSRFEEITDPDWCNGASGGPGNAVAPANGYRKTRADFEDIQVLLERRLAAMQESRELELLRRGYLAKAAKVFALEDLLTYQRDLREAQAKDASRALSAQTVGKLPWIIVILGVFCLSIMVMVRRCVGPL